MQSLSAHPTFAFAQPGQRLYTNPRLHHLLISNPRSIQIRAETTQQESQYVNYADSEKSVFPAEACDTVGGVACGLPGVGPEVKPSPKVVAQKASKEGPDREYLEYSQPKTVFPGEACDELGGEFCEPDYQAGVFPEVVSATK